MAYQFHAWARKSIAAHITVPDTLGETSGPADVRVRIPLEINVSGEKVSKQFMIAGPGDIIGISQEMIVRTDPRPNSGDFEPNYFASIEFYDEDFPWRYSSAGPVGENKSQLRPWLMLIVLTENEFVKTKKTIPLSSIIVKDQEVLPPHNEMHLWAHVHANFGDPDTPLENVIGSLRTQSKTDPDGLFSRIICPRKLEHDVLYHAFLVPVFESGRLAGLDLPNNQTPAQQAAWTNELTEIEMPVYYRWQFRTGANADFETLLRKMEPRKELDPKVGIRDLVCSNPGYIKVEQDGTVPPPSPAVLDMCGAVKQLSTEPSKLDSPVDQQPFVQEVKKHLDLAIQAESLEQDPVVTIPFYGYHHAKTFQDETPDFHPEQESWPHQLNRDPRNRAAAGLGTLVVQKKQEEFMQSAWQQLPKINEINRKIRHLQLAMEVNDRMLQGTFMKMGGDTGKMLAMARPVAARMKESTQSKTIYQTLNESQVPNATVSSALRRLSRPNGSISRKLNITGSFSLERVYNHVNPQSTTIAFMISPGVSETWLTTSSKIKINENLPEKFPDIASMEPNISSHTGGNAGAIISNDVKSVFNQNEEILSIGISQPVSKIKIPSDYHSRIVEGLKPEKTLLPGFRASIEGLPKPPETQQEVLPVMAHPDFPEPTYKYLSDINQDFIVPNLSLVPPNTIALMEPNYEFIHSFLIGINTEMARELLWREYPTDQRGTYFRQFWDPGGLRSPKGNDQAYKDIKPITDWGNGTALDKFSSIGKTIPNKPLVLLLKGDLLKKYPNTIVFAQKAVKKFNADKNKDELVIDESDDITKFEFPLFSANLAPDVRLLGFNLTVPQVKGQIQSSEPKPPDDPSPRPPVTGTHTGGVIGTKIDIVSQLTPLRTHSSISLKPNLPIDSEAGTHTDPETNPKIDPVTDLPVDPKPYPVDPKPVPQADPGWFFVLAEVPGEPRFGMDINYSPPKEGGNTWDNLSLENFEPDGVFVSGKKAPQPVNGKGWPNEKNENNPDNNIDTALETWGRCSADMAGILLQKPVMMAIHGSELLKAF